MTDAGMEGRTFTAQAGRVGYFGELCLSHIPVDKPLRVLDLGCGTGEQIFYLLAKRPLVAYVGVDISEPSVAAASAQAAKLGQDRAHFHATDYLSFETEPFDIVLCDSVLQNIPVDDRRLYAKLARDLRPGGRMLLSIPYDCFYNRALWGLRRLLRPLRGRKFEAVSLAVARRLHADWDPELLRERLPYLTMVPVRWDGRVMRRKLLESHGLRLLDAQVLPRVSIAKAKHRLVVYQRDPAG
jgi:trans-aconitate 2-methyltransferase